MWKLQDFSTTKILREIKIGHLDAQKLADLTIWAAMNVEFLGIFDTFEREIFPNIKIQSLQNC